MKNTTNPSSFGNQNNLYRTKTLQLSYENGGIEGFSLPVILEFRLPIRQWGTYLGNISSKKEMGALRI